MSVLYTNNASTTLSSSINSSATTIVLDTGTSALFPVITSGNHFYVTIADSNNNNEIVKVTATVGDTFTVERAADGTTASSWSAGDKVELRITKAMLDQLKVDAVSGYATAANLSAHTGNTSNPHSVTATQVGLTNVEDKSSATIRSEITSSNVTTALGYTPYNSTNPAGYTTNTGTVTGVTGTAPIVSSGGTAPAISISAATTSAAGSMSAADKTKLDGVATGATANTGTVTSVGGTGSYGGLTLSGTVTGSGNLTLGGTPTGTWPISVSGNAATATSATSAGNADTLDGNHASAFQAALVSGSNIKTVGGNSLLGSGDISVGGSLTGSILQTPMSTAPDGYLECDGSQLSQTTYTNLFAAIGHSYDHLGNVYVNGKPHKQQYRENTSQTTDITGWTSGTSLPSSLQNSQAIVTNNRVYLLGGMTDTSTYVSTVYTAIINSDGTLGTWSTGTSLPVGLANSQAIVTNNRVYLLGGATGNYSRTSTVYTAIINSDGTLGTWSTGTSLPVGLANSQAVITNSMVYLIGGYNGGATSAVYYAIINSDGTLGTWYTGTSLPGGIYGSQAIVTNNRVYLLGGYNSSDIPTSAVYYAIINSDGTLGTWYTGTSLPAALASSQAVITNNKLYLLGGITSSSPLSTVRYCSINSDGSLSTWNTGTSLGSTLANSQAIVTNNRVYLLGGYNNVATSVVRLAPFSGGLNDYLTLNKAYISTSPDAGKFNAPYIPYDNSKRLYSYIKY